MGTEQQPKRRTTRRKALHPDQETTSTPNDSLSPVQRNVMAMQHLVGNRAVQRMVAPIRQRTAPRVQRWDSPEHVKLGNAGVNPGYIVIDALNKEIPNRDKPINEWDAHFRELYMKGDADQKRFLKQGLKYGEIIALSGDFYSTYAELNKASITEIYNLLPLITNEATTDQLQAATGGRYLDLAAKNESHFSNTAAGKSNRETWHRMHIDALMAAINGDANAAWAMNAAADHFLTDAFSSGHMRPPRSELMKSTPGNIESKAWHDLDNNNGVDVTNKRGDKWTAYGDENMDRADNANAKNKQLVEEAVALSKADIQEALTQGKKYPVPDEKTRFKAEDLIPHPIDPSKNRWSGWVGSKDVSLISTPGIGINVGGVSIPIVPPIDVSIPVPTIGDKAKEYGHLAGSELPGIVTSSYKDDNEIREWVSKNPSDAISRVPVNEKERLIGVLLSNWVSDDDLDAIEKIIKSVKSADEMKYLRTRINPLDLTSLGQRTRLRVILLHQP